MSTYQLPRFFKGLLAIITIGVVAFLLGRYVDRRPRSTTTIDLSRESVIRQVRSLNRLEAASFTIEKVIEAGTNGNQFQDFLYGDRILLVAHGEVIAGLDLSQLGNQQVRANGTQLTLDLPAPTIFSTSLDNSKTKIFDRKLGLLVRGDRDLESQARAGAEAAITQAACEGGILTEAADNGRRHLQGLFAAVGFTEITVNIPAGECPIP